MTANELSAAAAAESVARIKQADEDALLAAEAFAYGMWPKYLEAKVYDINRRINGRYGTTSSAVSLFQPSELGESAA